MGRCGTKAYAAQAHAMMGKFGDELMTIAGNGEGKPLINSVRTEPAEVHMG